MSIKNQFLVALTAVLVPHSLMAQGAFNEMSYSKDKTTFSLNSPTASVEVDGVTGATPESRSNSKIPAEETHSASPYRNHRHGNGW